MDAVLDDVRDLITTAATDDESAAATSPISAPDLRLLISRLTVRSDRIKSEVKSYIETHRDEFTHLFTAASRSLSSLSLLHRSLSLLLPSLSPSSSPDSAIRLVADDIRANTALLREKRELLASVKRVLGFSERLGGLRRDLEAGRFVEAAATWREVETGLGGDVAERDGEPVVYALLRKECTRCFDEIHDVLVRFMERAVRFEQQHNAIHVGYFSDGLIHGIELHTVLEAMDVTGILRYGFAKAADMIVKFAITPVVTCKSNFIFIEEIKQEDGRDIEAILKLVSSPDHKIELDIGSIYLELIKVVQFIYGSVCSQRSDWMQSFGRLTWPRMSELIITNILAKVVPDDASKIADFQRVVTLTSEFETSLKEIHFISVSDSSDARLSDFADNVEVHFASRKKVEILAKARNLLLHSDFALPQEQTRRAGSKNEDAFQRFPLHAVDLLFLPESCVVSKAALQLMELVHQTLKDVCLSSTRVALEFYNAARDVLLLYEAIIPVKQERQLDGINQVAVLIHNDCLYLSHEILALAFEYRPDFPDPVKELVVFADMAPRFQLMAEQLLHRQVQLVIHNLKEAVDGADGFQNTHQKQQFESAKFSIDQVVFILEKVHIIWEPLLIASTYKRSMCTVLEPVFARMANDILQLDDMAAEETLQLQRLIQFMLEGLSSLLDSLTANTEMGKSKENLTRSIDELIPSLRKIRKLADLLDMPLKSITETWENGELVSCGFTLAEVQDFIRAIFADSPLRKECLRRIESAWF